MWRLQHFRRLEKVNMKEDSICFKCWLMRLKEKDERNEFPFVSIEGWGEKRKENLNWLVFFLIQGLDFVG